MIGAQLYSAQLVYAGLPVLILNTSGWKSMGNAAVVSKEKL